ncbi:hypothetical protein [Enterobacter bugandensis]|uniref:hypothetical protein n=1 Tax=Enterobacter bugandensis TaxID=881260 RepID=UPI00131F3A63|nr:hypothetical protein [Enterobacter bugandensis]QWZ48834.1 hypothetical protein I6L57_16970 [Enterobacter bugandensis]UBH41093.1 hypothetical protein LA316_05165 [Enterobacter bugandensis]UBH92807.1 hypothetical protein LA318_16345 [Enterobacter bugandensis]UBH99405.1 hypothetical protein LA326_04345 [Enterobacter bugandensis]
MENFGGLASLTLVGKVVEFVGDFDFLLEGEGVKRVVLVLIWMGFLYLFDF